MDKLPRVFVNPINHYIDNEQKAYTSFDREVKKENINISKEIDKLLRSTNHITKTKLRIYTSSFVKDIFLVSRSNNYIITIDNEKIKIDDIKKIELL